MSTSLSKIPLYPVVNTVAKFYNMEQWNVIQGAVKSHTEREAKVFSAVISPTSEHST